MIKFSESVTSVRGVCKKLFLHTYGARVTQKWKSTNRKSPNKSSTGYPNTRRFVLCGDCRSSVYSYASVLALTVDFVCFERPFGGICGPSSSYSCPESPTRMSSAACSSSCWCFRLYWARGYSNTTAASFPYPFAEIYEADQNMKISEVFKIQTPRSIKALLHTVHLLHCVSYIKGDYWYSDFPECRRSRYQTSCWRYYRSLDSTVEWCYML